MGGHVRNVSRLSSALIVPVKPMLDTFMLMAYGQEKSSLRGGMEVLTLSHMDDVSFANHGWWPKIIGFKSFAIKKRYW